MTPSTVTSPVTLDLFCTDEEPFLALTKILSGGPFPENVYKDIDPFLFEPANLPDDVWCYVKCNGNVDLSSGRWKPKGGDCKLYSNSPFTGWRTTYEYYKGQAPNEHKTAWLMQKYWMSQTDPCGNSKQKETNSLCKVFLGDEQLRDQIQKIDLSIIPNSEPIDLNHQLVVPDAASNNMASGSRRNSEMSEDDNMVELTVAGKSLDHHLEEILSEMDCVSRGDFLELLDLDNPAASPSSSSENSSCLTMSSDECFDSMALLQDIEHDNNLDTIQRDAACIRSSAPTRLRKEVVVHQGASSESLVSMRRSHSAAEENLKIDSTVLGSGCRESGLKLPNRWKGEASSSSSHNKIMSNGKETAVDGGKKKKKKTVARMKKIQKKYFCFFPF